MAKNRWAGDLCPYSRSQGFTSIVGDVESGISVFGFTIRATGATTAVVFKTVTGGRVTQMASINPSAVANKRETTWYEVIVTKVSAGSVTANYTGYTAITPTGFVLTGESGEDYDCIVRGKIAW